MHTTGAAGIKVCFRLLSDPGLGSCAASLRSGGGVPRQRPPSRHCSFTSTRWLRGPVSCLCIYFFDFLADHSIRIVSFENRKDRIYEYNSIT